MSPLITRKLITVENPVYIVVADVYYSFFILTFLYTHTTVADASSFQGL